MSDGEDQETGFWVASMFGHATRWPLVSVKLRDVSVQVTPLKAREMAMMLLEAAEAAEGDGFVVTFFEEQIGVDEEIAAQAMLAFRRFRQECAEADGRFEHGGTA